MSITAPYGTWPSPISPGTITTRTVGLSQVRVDGPDTYWVEQRASQAGRNVLLRRDGDGQIGELLPLTPSDELVDVRTRVHEYGGTAYDDSPVRTIVSGTDFVTSPTLSPDSKHLAWVTWNHPSMPWDEARLHVGDLLADGTIGEQTVVDGGEGYSVSEPRWTEEGELVHLANGSGFWNLYRTEGLPVRGTSREGWTARLRTRPLHPAEATFTVPAWQLGPHHYDVLDGDHLIASWARDGVWHLGTVRLANGELEEWNIGWQPMGNVASSSGRVVMLASRETGLPAIVEVKNGGVEVLRGSGEFDPELVGISFPDPVSWEPEDGGRAYGFYYPPASATHVGPPDELPPLIVSVHGGPTQAARPDYSLSVQYWTSRGFAVLEVNYRGSSGYSSYYRKALNGHWGVYDADDVVSGAQHLARLGLVDPARMAVRGASSGGFTVLSAITRSSVFSAATSTFGVADLALLARTTHKFESRYIETLVGASGPDDELMAQRSPINHVDDIHVPLLLLQGSDDPIVPEEQAIALHRAVAAQGLPVALEIFHGEGHGFRIAANIRRAYEAELSFYTQVWKLDSAEDARLAVRVENLDR